MISWPPYKLQQCKTDLVLKESSYFRIPLHSGSSREKTEQDGPAEYLIKKPFLGCNCSTIVAFLTGQLGLVS